MWIAPEKSLEDKIKGLSGEYLRFNWALKAPHLACGQTRCSLNTCLPSPVVSLWKKNLKPASVRLSRRRHLQRDATLLQRQREREREGGETAGSGSPMVDKCHARFIFIVSLTSSSWAFSIVQKAFIRVKKANSTSETFKTLHKQIHVQACQIIL